MEKDYDGHFVSLANTLSDGRSFDQTTVRVFLDDRVFPSSHEDDLEERWLVGFRQCPTEVRPRRQSKIDALQSLSDERSNLSWSAPCRSAQAALHRACYRHDNPLTIREGSLQTAVLQRAA